MIIKSVRIYRYSLGLNQPLTVKGRRLSSRDGLIIHLISNTGEESFGEIAPLPGFSRESLDEASVQIQSLAPSLCGKAVTRNLFTLNGEFSAWLNNDSLASSVRFGIESAVLNLKASHIGTPLYKLISKEGRPDVRVSGLLSGNDKVLVDHAKVLVSQGFTELKLKVAGDIHKAADMVRKVNRMIADKAVLHLDANQGWSFDEALAFAMDIGCAAVSYIEEPFKDVRRIPEFFDKTLIPVALDESLTTTPFDELRSLSGVEAIVFKPTILGGIEKTVQMARQVRGAALRPIISSSFESSIGISLLSSLAAASRSSYAAGLDTLKWFSTDLMKEPPRISRGIMRACEFPARPDALNLEQLKDLI